MRAKKTAFMLIVLMLIFMDIPEATAEKAPISAVNAVLMEQSTGRVLFEKDAHEKKKIASITKIMTAILAIESGKMNEMVTVSGNAFGTEGSSLFLQKGQKMKLEDLVYGLMLRSGNDAAVAIAEHVGGSLDGFIYMMNEKAAEVGMENTSFTNPHGLDNTPDHYSTAYDMALLTKYSMNNPVFAEISAAKTHRAPNLIEGWDYQWTNKNKMLKLYKYSTGGKTGFTKLARRTLVSTAEKDGVSLIAVTLNASSDWDDHMYLFNTAFKDYDMPVILKKGKINSIKHKFYKGKVYLLKEFRYPLDKEEKANVEIEIKLLKPKKGWEENADVPKIVGKAIVLLDGKSIGQRNIYFTDAAEEQRITFMESWKVTLLLFLGIKQDG